MTRASIILPAIVVAVVLALSSVFIVDEREKALVLQFGQIVRVKEEPGLGFSHTVGVKTAKTTAATTTRWPYD